MAEGRAKSHDRPRLNTTASILDTVKQRRLVSREDVRCSNDIGLVVEEGGSSRATGRSALGCTDEPDPDTEDRHSNRCDLLEDTSNTHWYHSYTRFTQHHRKYRAPRRGEQAHCPHRSLRLRPDAQAKGLPHPSIAIFPNTSVKLITGASHYNIEMGVSIPILRILNRICVRLHRNPSRADAENIMSISVKWKVASVATMKTTLSAMKVITNTRRPGNISRWKRKANESTRISKEIVLEVTQRPREWCRAHTGSGVSAVLSSCASWDENISGHEPG